MNACSIDNVMPKYEKTIETKLIKMLTTKGDITIELFHDKAPKTVDTFLRYIKERKFNGTIFHRVINGFVIQGGGFLSDMSRIETYGPVENESNNNISNKKGTIAMARTNDPNSATSQFFINLKDNNFLDRSETKDGYCVFGKVTDGIEIVEEIGEVATESKGIFNDLPIENIIIKEVDYLIIYLLLLILSDIYILIKPDLK